MRRWRRAPACGSRSGGDLVAGGGLLLAGAAAAETYDDGATHEVTAPIATPSFVRDSTGGAPTTVNMRAGADADTVEVEDASVLNVFDGAVVGQPDYGDTASGTVCGGSLLQLDVNDSADVEVSGGTLATGPSEPIRTTGGTLLVQAGSFENTSGLATKVALKISGGSTEFRGGTIVDGAVSVAGSTTSATFMGGDIGTDGFNVTSEGTLTLVGPSFSAGFGELSAGSFFNGTLSGTLADGTTFTSIAIVKTSTSHVFLVEGSLGLPLTSDECGPIGNPVPALPWPGVIALGFGLAGLGAMRAVRRPVAGR